jgi:nicotinamidase-related amidase
MPSLLLSSSSSRDDVDNSFSSSSIDNKNNDQSTSTASNTTSNDISSSSPSSPTLTRNPKSYPELRLNGPVAWYDDGELDQNDDAAADVASPSSGPPLPLPLLASKTALLLVDVQPQYWSQCPAVRKDFPDFPDRVQQLIQTCRDPRYTEAMTILWVYADYRFDTSPWLKQFHRLHQGKIPPEVHFDHQTGWEDFAKPNPNEPMIAKRSWSCTSQTQLLDILQHRGVDTVLVCGLITSVCVQHSAFGVFEAGYRTVLVTDACADRGLERHKAALALYGDYMYELKTVRQVQDELQMSAASSSLTNTTAAQTLLIKDNNEMMMMSSASTTATTLTAEEDDDTMDNDSDDDDDDDKVGPAPLSLPDGVYREIA